MIRITHQRPKCIGCNYCAEVAPFRWEMDETDGKCNLRDGKMKRDMVTVIAPDDEWDDNQEAARCCPVNIIRVERI